MREATKLAVPPRGFFVAGVTHLYCRPINLIYSPQLDQDNRESSYCRLAGGSLVFEKIELILRDQQHIYSFESSIDAARAWALAEGCMEELDELMLMIVSRRAGYFEEKDTSPLLMGIINVSPDSFFGAATSFNTEAAISRAHSLIAEGVDFIDVGGESTRPGSSSIKTSEEIDRVVAVIEGIKGFGVPISIDTSKAKVMEAALSAGASIINDITALTGDPNSLSLAAKYKVPVVLMHMKGTPLTMQKRPQYDSAILDVFDYLKWRVSVCLQAGILPENLIIDPGIGFGKNDDHNISILTRISLLHSLGFPILLGMSRKSLIASLSDGEPVDKRLPGSLAAAIYAAGEGVQLLRVHDVSETRQALAIKEALQCSF
ncbi:MAG: dihydropteroate synthase [Rhodospirillaceae bacterium]|nr:dihydropteroate synthase [Rhodospirillaceae bacterium]